MPDETAASDAAFEAAMWERVVHSAPFGHCAKCGQDLPIHTGGDGNVIVTAGFCPDDGVMTVWEVVDAAPVR